jgi:hypothetical protein
MPNTDRDTRYGHRAGTGANEPKHHERKEQDPAWKPRQGGDQSRSDQDRRDPRSDRPARTEG